MKEKIWLKFCIIILGKELVSIEMVDNLTRQKLAIEIYLYGYLYCVVMRKLSIKWK